MQLKSSWNAVGMDHPSHSTRDRISPHRAPTALFRWPLCCTRGGVVLRDLVLDHTFL